MAIRVDVDINNVTITEEDIVNAGEYNVNTCYFTFSEEFDNLVKRAVFTNVAGNKYMTRISDENTCIIPNEVLQAQGNIILGVYGYKTEKEEEKENLVLRYSPAPDSFFINDGSYSDREKPTLAPQDASDLIKKIEDLIAELETIIAERSC